MEVEFEALHAKLWIPVDTKNCFRRLISNASVGLLKGWPTIIVRTQTFGSMESFSAAEQLINQCEKMTLLMKAGTVT